MNNYIFQLWKGTTGAGTLNLMCDNRETAQKEAAAYCRRNNIDEAEEMDAPVMDLEIERFSYANTVAYLDNVKSDSDKKGEGDRSL